MNRKLQIMTAAAVLVVLPGVAFAVAQADAPKTVPKSDVAQPAVIQQTPVATVGPVSRPAKPGVLGVQDSISVALTVKECEDLGGTVNPSKTCTSGKKCYTAGADGVIRGKCIDDKENN